MTIEIQDRNAPLIPETRRGVLAPSSLFEDEQDTGRDASERAGALRAVIRGDLI